MIIPRSFDDLPQQTARFQESPEVCDELDKDISRHFTSKITAKLTRDQWRTSSGTSGMRFMQTMVLKLAVPSQIKTQTASLRGVDMQGKVDAGLTSATTEALNHFVHEYELCNATLVGSNAHKTPDQLAGIYEEVIESLGSAIHTLFIVERNRLFSEAGGAAHLEMYSATLLAASNVLGVQELVRGKDLGISTD